MSGGMPELGSKISLISKADIRYEGRLYTVDPQECTIALSNVRSFGTEDRDTQFQIAPQSQIYDYILFRGSDIKDIRVVNNNLPHPNDPAIMQVQLPNGQHIMPHFPMPNMNAPHVPPMSNSGYGVFGGMAPLGLGAGSNAGPSMTPATDDFKFAAPAPFMLGNQQQQQQQPQQQLQQQQQKQPPQQPQQQQQQPQQQKQQSELNHPSLLLCNPQQHHQQQQQPPPPPQQQQPAQSQSQSLQQQQHQQQQQLLIQQLPPPPPQQQQLATNQQQLPQQQQVSHQQQQQPHQQPQPPPNQPPLQQQQQQQQQLVDHVPSPGCSTAKKLSAAAAQIQIDSTISQQLVHALSGGGGVGGGNHNILLGSGATGIRAVGGCTGGGGAASGGGGVSTSLVSGIIGATVGLNKANTTSMPNTASKQLLNFTDALNDHKDPVSVIDMLTSASRSTTPISLSSRKSPTVDFELNALSNYMKKRQDQQQQPDQMSQQQQQQHSKNNHHQQQQQQQMQQGNGNSRDAGHKRQNYQQRPNNTNNHNNNYSRNSSGNNDFYHQMGRDRRDSGRNMDNFQHHYNNQQRNNNFQGGNGQNRAWTMHRGANNPNNMMMRNRGGNGGRGGRLPNQGFRQMGLNTMGGMNKIRNKNTIKFEQDFDFEQANNKFEELRSLITKLQVGDDAKSDQCNDAGTITTSTDPPQMNGEPDKKDDSGNETGAGEHEPEDDPITVGYDKTKSFFDNISCEAAQDRTKSKKNDWRQERKLNSETFGVSSTRRGGYRGRGNYYNRNAGGGGGGFAGNYMGGGGMGGNYNRGYRYRNRVGNGNNNPNGGGNGSSATANNGGAANSTNPATKQAPPTPAEASEAASSAAAAAANSNTAASTTTAVVPVMAKGAAENCIQPQPAAVAAGGQ